MRSLFFITWRTTFSEILQGARQNLAGVTNNYPILKSYRKTARSSKPKQLAAINKFPRKLAKCLADASFLVFNWNNILFPETELSVFPFKLFSGLGNWSQIPEWQYKPVLCLTKPRFYNALNQSETSIQFSARPIRIRNFAPSNY